jgi:hypothetical protein
MGSWCTPSAVPFTSQRCCSNTVPAHLSATTTSFEGPAAIPAIVRVLAPGSICAAQASVWLGAEQRLDPPLDVEDELPVGELLLVETVVETVDEPLDDVPPPPALVWLWCDPQLVTPIAARAGNSEAHTNLVGPGIRVKKAME